jgi:hypothetical protein
MSATHSALSPVERELYEFAVRQVKAHGLRTRTFRDRSRIFQMIFGPREFSRLDLHRRPDPVLKPVKRAERVR